MSKIFCIRNSILALNSNEILNSSHIKLLFPKENFENPENDFAYKVYQILNHFLKMKSTVKMKFKTRVIGLHSLSIH